jgi:hypothetical protein
MRKRGGKNPFDASAPNGPVAGELFW